LDDEKPIGDGKIKFMNAIDGKPIQNSYLPLDNYKDFKVFMEE
jgi:hypothetical protein|tara:strand:+ start:443 stop:571 length:129 start_codon:yes stop_codon:yes gene_type:complete